MRVFHGFDSLPRFECPAVTVGSFDGVHLGHRAILERLAAEARRGGGESIVLTFEPHPRMALGRAAGMRLLTKLEEKIALLEALGADHVIVIPFDRAFAALSGREFVEHYLLGKVGARTLVAGYNHRFGHDARDSRSLADTPGLRIVEVDERVVEGDRVSSTVIRRLLDRGERAEAERLLGHPLHAAGTAAILFDPMRTTALTERLVALWEASVRATHTFLTDGDIAELTPCVREAVAAVETLYVAYDGPRPVAFMGTEAGKVEMLFVAPEHFGQGIGSRLIGIARERGVNRVDVNEQNPAAVAFYEHMGFEVFERAETDEQGRPFPILKMKSNR